MGTITCGRWNADGAKSWNRPPRISASAPRPRNARTGSTDRASMVADPAVPMSHAYRPAGSAFPGRNSKDRDPTSAPSRLPPTRSRIAWIARRCWGRRPGRCRWARHCGPGPAGRSARRRRRLAARSCRCRSEEIRRCQSCAPAITAVRPTCYRARQRPVGAGPYVRIAAASDAPLDTSNPTHKNTRKDPDRGQETGHRRFQVGGLVQALAGLAAVLDQERDEQHGEQDAAATRSGRQSRTR